MAKGINIIYDMSEFKLYNGTTLIGETHGLHDDILTIFKKYCDKGWDWVNSYHREIKPLPNRGKRSDLYQDLTFLIKGANQANDARFFANYLSNHIFFLNRLGASLDLNYPQCDKTVCYIRFGDWKLKLVYYDGQKALNNTVNHYDTGLELTKNERISFLKSLIGLGVREPQTTPFR